MGRVCLNRTDAEKTEPRDRGLVLKQHPLDVPIICITAGDTSCVPFQSPWPHMLFHMKLWHKFPPSSLPLGLAAPQDPCGLYVTPLASGPRASPIQWRGWGQSMLPTHTFRIQDSGGADITLGDSVTSGAWKPMDQCFRGSFLRQMDLRCPSQDAWQVEDVVNLPGIFCQLFLLSCYPSVMHKMIKIPNKTFAHHLLFLILFFMEIRLRLS